MRYYAAIPRVYTLSTRSNGLSRPSKISVFCPKLAIRHASCFSYLQKELTSRRLPLLCDPASLVPSYLLSTTLSDFLPPSSASLTRLDVENLGRTSSGRFCHLGHHLVYFPPAVPLSSLLSDGTDPAQSPGSPFVRRMWAGGKLDLTSTIVIGKAAYPAFCAERISDVSIKGLEGQEKIFVNIERRILNFNLELARTKSGTPRYNTKLIASSVEKKGMLIENRTLVFMRQRDNQGIEEAALPEKILKPTHKPTFSHTLTPTAALLFRFSALTYNAHAIHLDKEYCRNVEGYRNLLVHGPLSLIFMVQVLISHLAENTRKNPESSENGAEYVTGIEYRNLAPLYAEEEMIVRGRKRKEGEYDVWIEGSNGGYAVKGLATTRRKSKVPNQVQVPLVKFPTVSRWMKAQLLPRKTPRHLVKPT